MIAIEATRGVGLQLFDLTRGRGPEFYGRRLSHYTLDASLIPLQHNDAVTLVDTMQEHETLTLRASCRVLSLVSGAGAFHALCETDTNADSSTRHFLVLQFDSTSGAETGQRKVSLEYASLVPAIAEQRRSQPFLTFDSERGAQLSVVAGCPRCPDAEAAPLRWYRRGFEPTEQWQVTTIADDDLTTLDRFPRAFVPPPPPVAPPAVQEVLARLPRAEIGEVEQFQHSVTFTTGNTDRECSWSLIEARRLNCVPASLAGPHEGSTSGAACRLEIGAFDADGLPGATRITCDGHLLATAYDLSPDEWALVLPDGRYAGTDGAIQYLAFYRGDGSLLSAEEMMRLRASTAEIARALAPALEQTASIARRCTP